MGEAESGCAAAADLVAAAGAGTIDPFGGVFGAGTAGVLGVAAAESA